MKLSELTPNIVGHIRKVRGDNSFRRRIAEMGFVKGKEVSVIKYAPMKDPIEFNVMGYEVSLRKFEADQIDIELDRGEDFAHPFNGTIEELGQNGNNSKKSSSKKINVAFVGNPNSGKTTLFNSVSNSKEKVGNYSGVTVNTKVASFNVGDYEINVSDLPGAYSVTASSPEESFVRTHIFGEEPDVIINVVDSSSLERNLLLTTQLIDMELDIVIALNMYDELKSKGDEFDHKSLGDMIGIPMIPTIGSKGEGSEELFTEVIKVYENKNSPKRKININYGTEIEESIGKIAKCIDTKSNRLKHPTVSFRYLAIKLLEDDNIVNQKLSNCENIKEITLLCRSEITRLEKFYGDNSSTIMTDAKFGFISGALKETYKTGKTDRYEQSKSIDNILTHKYLGIPIFLVFMWLTFQSTFVLGQYPMDWIESGVTFLSSTINSLMAEGSLKDLLLDGMIAGVGSVIVFLPNILILFFFVSLMEDTGYMARVAFIADRFMHKIGLHGKSIIPLIMGFGCNVPAVMATRTLESKDDRLLTMLISPFMSCNARLSVYILIIGAFFTDNPGTVLFSIYSAGVLLAILVAILFKKTFFKHSDAPFVMELPPYRIPTLKTTLIHMWHKSSQYLRKMGGTILIASVIIWALGYFPRDFEGSEEYNSRIETLEHSQLNTEMSVVELSKTQDKINELKLERSLIHSEKSYIGRMGNFIEPVISPLGFDQKMGMSLIAGLAAKEIVVSTMGVLYGAGEGLDENSKGLTSKLKSQRYKSGEKKGQLVFTPLVAYTFMLFILIYFPCIAVIAGIKKEAESWKWASFTMVYTTLLAWIVSFLVYNIGSMFI